MSVDEAEEAFNSDTLELGFDLIDNEERLDEVGETHRGRVLRLVTIIRHQEVRVVTAFDAPKVEYIMRKGQRND